METKTKKKLRMFYDEVRYVSASLCLCGFSGHLRTEEVS
jgi:hypothetical protein